MKTMMKLVKLAAVVMLTITSCTQEAPDIVPEAPGNAFKLDLTDSPANYSRVDVQMTEIDVYNDTKGWVPLYTSVRSINILTLANGTTRNIAYNNNVPVGHYSKVRILFADRNTVTIINPVVIDGIDYDGGSTLPLKWAHSSFHVEIPVDKDVTPERGAQVLLDFDVGTSISSGAGAMMIDPAISVMKHISTGIKGTVVGGDAAAFIQLDNGLHLYSAYSDRAGRFSVRGVAEGEYHMIIRVLKKNPTTGVLEEKKYERDDMKITGDKHMDIGVIRF